MTFSEKVVEQLNILKNINIEDFIVWLTYLTYSAIQNIRFWNVSLIFLFILLYNWKLYQLPKYNPLGVFTESAPLGRFSHRVAMSVCVSVYLCAPSRAVFFKACHWP